MDSFICLFNVFLFLHQALAFHLETVSHRPDPVFAGDDLTISYREDWGETGSWTLHWFRIDIGINGFQSRYPIDTGHPDYAIKNRRKDSLTTSHMMFQDNVQTRYRYYDVDFYSQTQSRIYSIRYIAPYPWPSKGPWYKTYKPWVAVVQTPEVSVTYNVHHHVQMTWKFGVGVEEHFRVEIWREVIRGSGSSKILQFDLIYRKQPNNQETTNSLLEHIWVEATSSTQAGIKLETFKLMILPAEEDDKGFYSLRVTGTDRDLQDSLEFKGQLYPDGTDAVVPSGSSLIALSSPSIVLDDPEVIRLIPRQSTDLKCIFFNTDQSDTFLSKDGEDLNQSEALFVLPYGTRAELVYRLLYPSPNDEGLYKCYSRLQSKHRYFRIVYGSTD